MTDELVPAPPGPSPEPAAHDDPDLARLIDLVERMGPVDESELA